MNFAHVLAIAVIAGGNPGAVNADVDLPTVPTPTRLKAFVAAMESMSPEWVTEHGRRLLVPRDTTNVGALTEFFSRDGVVLTSVHYRAPGRVSFARLSTEVSAMKGPVFQYLLGVAFQLRAFYEGRAPTVVGRDGELLVMEVAREYTVTFAQRNGRYVVVKIHMIEIGGDL